MISMIELEKRVINTGLCTGCGACQGMCPYFQSYEGRTYCGFECGRNDGRCVRFCPRMPTDLSALRSRFFSDSPITEELGPFLGLYVARAAAPEVGVQHGGVMTALVSLALREGFIDGAVLTKKDGVLEPRGFVATTEEEVASCAGSCFQIPPTLSELNKALTGGSFTSLGLVGTPCKTLAAYKMKAEPFEGNHNNASAIGMVFGLFCGWGLDWKGLEKLTKDCCPDAAHADILPSSYHSMELEGGSTVSVDLDEVYPLVRQSCKYCADMTAEFADLSVGGARTGKGWQTDKGYNQIIVRTEKGARLLEIAKEKGVLEFIDPPEGAMDKLKRASVNKKRTAITNLDASFGSLEYLEPERERLMAVTGK